MSLINAKPRFAFDPTDNTIFDYATSKSVPATGTFQSSDGKWDAALLAEFIVTGQSVEGARVAESEKSDVPPAHLSDPDRWFLKNAPDSQPVDKVEQANRDFLATAGDTEVAAESTTGALPDGVGNEAAIGEQQVDEDGNAVEEEAPAPAAE